MQKTATLNSYSRLIRLIGGLLLFISVIICAGLIALLATKEAIYKEVTVVTELNKVSAVSTVTPFPVSVNPKSKEIFENPLVSGYLDKYLAYEVIEPVRKSWLHQLTRRLTEHSWYQNLASPISRILVIWPGDRKEEVVDNFGDILHWNDQERETFSTTITVNPPALPDGTFFPGRYITTKDATPEVVAALVTNRFANEVQAHYPESIETIIPLKDALTVASLLEREAYEFDQMREISGVIWNRLFTNMPLQLDATLQYVKGSKPNEPKWWPLIAPRDKYLESPYNTYQEAGLPPNPIANPSAAAILAALNPIVTDCMFYFHDDDGTMYCSVTYEEHVAKLKSLYGRGQ